MKIATLATRELPDLAAIQGSQQTRVFKILRS